MRGLRAELEDAKAFHSIRQHEVQLFIRYLDAFSSSFSADTRKSLAQGYLHLISLNPDRLKRDRSSCARQDPALKYRCDRLR